MPLKKKKEITILGYGRSKDQGRIRSSKEVEHGKDISEVNMSNYTFHGRFKDEKMSL